MELSVTDFFVFSDPGPRLLYVAKRLWVLGEQELATKHDQHPRQLQAKSDQPPAAVDDDWKHQSQLGGDLGAWDRARHPKVPDGQVPEREEAKPDELDVHETAHGRHERPDPRQLRSVELAYNKRMSREASQGEWLEGLLGLGLRLSRQLIIDKH